MRVEAARIVFGDEDRAAILQRIAAALRSGSDRERAEEFADVLAWLATLANVAGVDLEAAVRAVARLPRVDGHDAEIGPVLPPQLLHPNTNRHESTFP